MVKAGKSKLSKAPAPRAGPAPEVAARFQSLRTPLCVLLLLLVTACAFAPSVQNGFTNWDDDVYLTDNPAVRGFTLPNIRHIFTSSLSNVYVPLTALSFAVQHPFSGDEPAGYHVVNLLFHLANCVLAFLLLRMLTGQALASFLAALLFGIHPLRAESVCWITERKDVLYVFFYLIAGICYHVYRTRGKWPYYVLSIAVFLLSLLSKPTAVTFPAVLILMDVFIYRRPAKALFPDKIPFLLLSAACVVVSVHFQDPSAGSGAGPATRVMLAGFAVLFYLSKLVMPAKLSAMYPYTSGHRHAELSLLVAGDGVVAGGGVLVGGKEAGNAPLRRAFLSRGHLACHANHLRLGRRDCRRPARVLGVPGHFPDCGGCHLPAVWPGRNPAGGGFGAHAGPGCRRSHPCHGAGARSGRTVLIFGTMPSASIPTCRRRPITTGEMRISSKKITARRCQTTTPR